MPWARERGASVTYNLADLFELVARAVGEREALVAGDVRLTYRELDQRANRLGHALARLGAGPHTKVGILARNRAEWVEGMLGAFKARAVPINLNYRYTAEELRYVLDDADVEVLVLERGFGPAVGAVRDRLPLLRHLVVLEDHSDAEVPGALPYDQLLASSPPGPLPVERSSDDLYILYTGGTTGRPKGVVWRHEDAFFSALLGGGFGGPPVSFPEEVAQRIFPAEARPISMVVAPLMHGAAQWNLLIVLLGGGTVVLYTQPRFDPHEVWRIVERERCTILAVVGDAMARPLAEALAEGSYDVSSVVHVGSGGAVFSPAVQELLRSRLPHAVVADTVGASEVGASGSAAPEGVRRFVPWEDVAVLDDDLRPVPPGSGRVGRLARRGHIPLGYYKDEAKTAATFVTDAQGVRWAIPGDYATVEADGTIVLLGRGSQCINTGGEKVFPEEVEAVLKEHPDVFDAVVVGVPDERFGERVAAVVQPRGGRAPTLEELAAHCRRHLAGYKVPRHLVLVEAVERTPAGKADYRWARSVAERAGASARGAGQLPV